MENRPIQRILLVIELIEGLIDNDPKTETFYTDLEYFRSYNWLLNDLDNLEKTFKIISEEAKGSVSISFHLTSVRGASATNDEQIVGHNISGVRVHFVDPARLKSYGADVRGRIKQKEAEITLTAVVSDNHVLLSAEDGTKTCVFKTGQRRDLLKILLSKKRYFTCKELAVELETTEKSIRQTVGYLRERIAKDLKINTTHIISNDPKTGDKYGFLNIIIT